MARLTEVERAALREELRGVHVWREVSEEDLLADIGLQPLSVSVQVDVSENVDRLFDSLDEAEREIARLQGELDSYEEVPITASEIMFIDSADREHKARCKTFLEDQLRSRRCETCKHLDSNEIESGQGPCKILSAVIPLTFGCIHWEAKDD